MRFSAKQRKMLIRIVLGAVLLIIAVLLPFEGIWRFLIFLVPYLIVGYAPLLKAGRNILHGQIFDENFLMALATIGAAGAWRISRGSGRHAVLSGWRAV